MDEEEGSDADLIEDLCGVVRRMVEHFGRGFVEKYLGKNFEKLLNVNSGDGKVESDQVGKFAYDCSCCCCMYEAYFDIVVVLVVVVVDAAAVVDDVQYDIIVMQFCCPFGYCCCCWLCCH